MDYNEIIKALVLIRDICKTTNCSECPFRSYNDDCGISEKDPQWWDIRDIDSWRVFK